jgi:hypothetical protein
VCYELWAMGCGLWAVSSGRWAMSCELWALGYGLWALSSGLLLLCLILAYGTGSQNCTLRLIASLS